MLAYYMDEHIDPGVVAALRKEHIDVLTAQEARRAGAKIPDPMQCTNPKNGTKFAILRQRSSTFAL